MSDHTPTPEPSEVAETTAGERECPHSAWTRIGIAQAIGTLCVLGTDDPQAVAAECLRIARGDAR